MSRALLRVKNHLTAIRCRYAAASTSKPTSESPPPGRPGYVILIPEVPPDTPETNPLLRTDEIPDFNGLTTVQWRNAVIKLCLELENAIWKTEETFTANPPSLPTIEQISTSIDLASVPLHYVWSLLKTMSVVNNDVFHSEVYAKFHDRASLANGKKYQSDVLYKVWRDLEIPTASTAGSSPEARLVSKYLTEAKLSGLQLTGNAKEEFTEITNTLEQDRQRFHNNLQLATSRFKHLIIDPKFVGSMPHEGLLAISKSGTDTTANRGPWVVKLTSPAYEYFMEYCPERALRWNTWQAYVSRNSNTGGDKTISNSIPIEEIRTKRARQAKILGYESYADLSMVTKMAGNLENVKTMIASLFVVANSQQSEEISSLQSFAESRGFDHKLKPWDIPYWRRKQARSLYNLEPSLVESYFPFPSVMSGMFSLASDLFGIQIQKENRKGWHEDVEFYSVSDSKGLIGHFFVDPYSRTGQKLPGSWMLGNRTKYDKLHATPLATLVFNFKPPMYGKPSLLSLDDINELFEKFGEMLQHILTTMPYPEISGTTNIEWDSTKVASKFMSMWLGNKSVLSGLSSHFESGEKLPDKILGDLLRSRKHLAAYDLSHQLYLSDLDIELYSTTEFWMDVTKRLWSLYKSSAGLLLDKADAHPCSFHEIFSGNYAAAFYSTLWSRMLAADIYRAFVSEGHEKENWKTGGARFRSTFLSLGGGYHPSEVFRQFRGRDPSPDALLWELGLKNISESSELPEEKQSQAGSKHLRGSSAN